MNMSSSEFEVWPVKFKAVRSSLYLGSIQNQVVLSWLNRYKICKLGLIKLSFFKKNFFFKWGHNFPKEIIAKKNCDDIVPYLHKMLHKGEPKANMKIWTNQKCFYCLTTSGFKDQGKQFQQFHEIFSFTIYFFLLTFLTCWADNKLAKSPSLFLRFRNNCFLWPKKDQFFKNSWFDLGFFSCLLYEQHVKNFT